MGTQNIVIRADSSILIGTGHVMRDLTLAHELRNDGANVQFIHRQFKGNAIRLIKDQGFKVSELSEPGLRSDAADSDSEYAKWLGVSQETDARETIEVIQQLDKKIDWLIIDHYALDETWEKYLQPYVDKIMVIDDLADRRHLCHLLLDQNFYLNMEQRYEGLVPSSCVLLLGPKYALLRKEFTKVKGHVRNGKVHRILVFFGGSDPANETEKAINAIHKLNNYNIHIDVVVGQSNPNKDKIKTFCDAFNNFHYYCQINYIAELMTKADLAIGAGGSTTWERCYLGLPALTIIVANNQEQMTMDLAAEGFIFNLGWGKTVSVENLLAVIKQMMDHPEALKVMSQKSIGLMDGLVPIKNYIME